jgi:hypothetical protein
MQRNSAKKAGVKYNKEGNITINHIHYAGAVIRNIIESEGYLAEEADKLQDMLDNMLGEMLKQLRRSYDYLTSREAIIDTIKANEWMFTENGKID